MDIQRGKQTSCIDAAALAELSAGRPVHIDLGTGDGSFVRHAAGVDPRGFYIGVDACRENLIEASRRAPENALYVIANAETLPAELIGLAERITVNFPWGSLLAGLLQPGSAVIDGLRGMALSGAGVDLRINAGALAEQGWALEAGLRHLRGALIEGGFELRGTVEMGAAELRQFPSSWAKRLAYGRDPRAVSLQGRYQAIVYAEARSA